MTPNGNSNIVPGWVGGFAESNPNFAYPHPDLSSIPMLDNMANIALLQRQQRVLWPEFSWQTEKGNADPKRCFQMFAPDISRAGYTDTGRVYSIICPQQGVCTPFGCLNVEVTVTGQGGWVNETNRELAADMSVEGKIWFSPSGLLNRSVKSCWGIFNFFKLPFPANKANAIRVSTRKFGSPDQPIFPVRKGETTLFESPAFAKHPEAWAVANVEVEIGPIAKTGIDIADDFNELVMKIFNAGTGNMLQLGNLLTWNVWFTAPELVDKEEWRTHAEKWRKSINADHGSPGGSGTAARYFDGTPFNAINELMDDVISDIEKWVIRSTLKKL